MKTRMKQLTAGTLLALLMIVGNVQAEGTEVKASSLEVLTETKLELENWMMDENVWNETAFIWSEQATEESLNLENWMTDEITWEASTVSVVNEETEKEVKLKIESWMTADNVWNR